MDLKHYLPHFKLMDSDGLNSHIAYNLSELNNIAQHECIIEIVVYGKVISDIALSVREDSKALFDLYFPSRKQLIKDLDKSANFGSELLTWTKLALKHNAKYSAKLNYLDS